MSITPFQLNFDEEARRVDEFYTRFDVFLNSEKSWIQETTDHYTAQEKRERDNEMQVSQQLAELRDQELDQARARRRLVEEVETSRNAIEEHSEKRRVASELNQTVSKQLTELKENLERARQDQSNKKKSLLSQTEKDYPELEFWERILGLRVEAVVENAMKFVFTGLDINDSHRECSFVLDLSNFDGQVRDCDPILEPRRVDQLMEALNSNREYTVFLRDIRNAFKEAL